MAAILLLHTIFQKVNVSVVQTTVQLESICEGHKKSELLCVGGFTHLLLWRLSDSDIYHQTTSVERLPVIAALHRFLSSFSTPLLFYTSLFQVRRHSSFLKHLGKHFPPRGVVFYCVHWHEWSRLQQTRSRWDH